MDGHARHLLARGHPRQRRVEPGRASVGRVDRRHVGSTAVRGHRPRRRSDRQLHLRCGRRREVLGPAPGRHRPVAAVERVEAAHRDAGGADPRRPLLGATADGAERVGDAARAAGLADVTVADHSGQVEQLTGRVLGGTSGGEGDRAGGIGEVLGHLPADDSRDALERGGRRGGLGVVADHHDAYRTGVEAHRVCADDRPVDAAATALPDRAELVDHEVVGDVGPASTVHVERLDGAEDAGHVPRAVRVAAVGVVDHRELDRAGVAGRQRGTGAPDVAGPNPERRRSCRPGHRGRVRGDPTELVADGDHLGADGVAGTEADLVAGSRPDPQGRGAGSAGLGAAGVGALPVVGLERLPPAQVPVGVAHADQHRCGRLGVEGEADGAELASRVVGRDHPVCTDRLSGGGPGGVDLRRGHGGDGRNVLHRSHRFGLEVEHREGDDREEQTESEDDDRAAEDPAVGAAGHGRRV